MVWRRKWDKRFIWNTSNCECECDKLCDVRQYLDYKNFKYRRKLIDKLVEECGENIEEINWFIIQLRLVMEKYAILVRYK